MDHTQNVRLKLDELTEAVLTGATVHGPNDEKIGTISRVQSSDGNTEVVIDVGGFLGFGARPVLVRAIDLDIMRDESGNLHAISRWSKSFYKDMPKYFGTRTKG